MKTILDAFESISDNKNDQGDSGLAWRKGRGEEWGWDGGTK